jgi:hypothetical protein
MSRNTAEKFGKSNEPLTAIKTWRLLGKTHDISAELRRGMKFADDWHVE